MDAYGSFFVGEHVEKTFHHSSLLSGSPVKGAGELMVKDGKLLKVSDRSGHYLPGPEHMYSVLWTLKEVHQVPLHGVVVEMYKRDDKGNLIVGQLGYEIGQQEAMSILNA
jgi:hypothetical protein